MATQVLTFLMAYEGLEDKIWRKVQVSSNWRLDQLGYLVLAAFDTQAYHLFAFTYKGKQYELPDEEFDFEDQADACDVSLNQLRMEPGDCLQMIYDFGLDQVFNLTLLSAEPMPRGKGAHYPWIVDGKGRGILDDMPVDELQELIAQIDKNGKTDEPVFYHSCVAPWDYRDFDIKLDNMLLKHKIRSIERGYAVEPDEDEDDYLDEDDE